MDRICYFMGNIEISDGYAAKRLALLTRCFNSATSAGVRSAED